MKHLFIIFSLLITSVSWCQESKIKNISLNNMLENYKWKKRILLLIVNEEDTALVNEVNKFFITQKCRNEERNLELLKVIRNNNNYIEMAGYFKNKTGIWLIGYDGYIKAYSEDNSLLSDIYNLINNMPIRKEEMEGFKANC